MTYKIYLRVCFDVCMIMTSITSCLHSLRKTLEKSVTNSGYAYSRSDSNFERSNISLKENKWDGVDLTVSTTAFEKKRENSMVFGRLYISPRNHADYLEV